MRDKPKFECYTPHEMDEDDAYTIEAWDAEDAAGEFAKRADDDAAEGFQDRREVRVRKAGEADWQRFFVVAEATVTYHVYDGD
jgi:hypothetical protein